MKKLLLLASVTICGTVKAGGTGSGGIPPSLRDNMFELADIAFGLDTLPKIYVDGDTFRRTQARLSVSDTKPVLLHLDSESIQVKKVRQRIVSEDLTQELLRLPE
jgi:hypothetical protein